MARIVKIFKTLRTHWKKSTFAVCLGYFGLNYAYDKHKTFLMMREYSKDALGHGKRKLPPGAQNKHITLLLNPTAGGRKGKGKLEKYGEPLLHLAGFLVSTVKTERIDEAKDLAGVIEKTNVIAVAGGDGTIFETVTGLLRRNDADEAVKRYPIGIIPVGSENQFAKRFFSKPDVDPTEAKFIADSAMAVVNHRMKSADVMEIQIVDSENIAQKNDKEESGAATQIPTSSPPVFKKPFYSLVGITMGQYREAKKLKDNMPFIFGQFFSTFWSLFRVEPFVVRAEINYIPTCIGCAKCKKEQEEIEENRRLADAERNKAANKNYPQSSIWSRLTSIFSRPVLADDDNQVQIREDVREDIIVNPECGVRKSICVDTTELNILVNNGGGSLRVEIGNKFERTDFMIEGLKRLKGESPNYKMTLDCREIEIRPIQAPEFFTIDNEEFEVKTVNLKVIKDRINLFVP